MFDIIFSSDWVVLSSIVSYKVLFSSIVFLKLSISLFRFFISISVPSLYLIAKDLISLNLLEISSNFFFDLLLFVLNQNNHQLIELW